MLKMPLLKRTNRFFISMYSYIMNAWNSMELKDLRKYKSQIYEIAAKYKITKVYIFGSVARGEQANKSDIDFLLDLEDGATPFSFFGFQHETSKLLGLQVDVVPSNYLPEIENRAFANSILSEAIAL